MNSTDTNQVLVLGATGKTGSRVAERLSAHEVSVRTAARSGADARFDWDNQATWEQTLRGATGAVPRLAHPPHRLRRPGGPVPRPGRTGRGPSRHLPQCLRHGAR